MSVGAVSVVRAAPGAGHIDAHAFQASLGIGHYATDFIVSLI